MRQLLQVVRGGVVLPVRQEIDADSLICCRWAVLDGFRVRIDDPEGEGLTPGGRTGKVNKFYLSVGFRACVRNILFACLATKK